MTRDEFDQWFRDPITAMNAEPHGGFAVMMVTIPLAERLCRIRSGIADQDFREGRGDLFNRAFSDLFPCIDIASVADFRSVYRNGLLNQATFNSATRRGRICPSGWISGDHHFKPETISYNSDENSFTVHPARFSATVLKAIDASFDLFCGSPQHPIRMPVVEAAQPPSDSAFHQFHDLPMRSGVPPERSDVFPNPPNE